MLSKVGGPGSPNLNSVWAIVHPVHPLSPHKCMFGEWT